MGKERLKHFFEDHWPNNFFSRLKLMLTLQRLEGEPLGSLELIQKHILQSIYNIKRDYFSIVADLEGRDLSYKERVYISFYRNLFPRKIVDNYALDLNLSAFPLEKLSSLLEFSLPTQVMVYLICSEDRKRPATMVIKNRAGEFLTKKFECLVHGRENKFFFLPNGATPAGVYCIHGVMPDTNNQKLFGKYHRLIIDFVGTEQVKLYLPKEMSCDRWYLPALIGKRLGREHLRIHGTGKKNFKFWASFYPHVTTSGCISMREDRGRTDQRDLLQTLLLAQGAKESDQNYEKIRASLYIIETKEEEFDLALKKLDQLL